MTTRTFLPRSAAAACLLLAGAAWALDYPARKPGLWEMTIQGDSGAKMPVMSTQQCIDAATDKAMREMGDGAQQQTCSKQDMRNEGGRIVIESVCRIGTSTATTRAVVTGDFSTGYRMESRSAYSPPMMGRSEGTAVIEAKWVGPCKAGQKPGDMVLPNGMKMNLLDMPAARGK
ncbi:DUF3617 domain-containing protein [Variovorax sp. JS1663]|uniref:DUF3617 domain-containing protein n=1 Tax=Variovorax sp. JS1663 TaxID=1851577 RepID=UPI000B344385|nr:DUF3617 family protein [Variovorax sp. JS1663]OUM04284.1 hypothetical protein A8M77_00805 [Variovorax sp. JS1663]